MTSFEVFVENSFLLNNKAAEYKLTFSDKEKAFSAVRAVVDTFLRTYYQTGMSAEQLEKLYSIFGEHPMVFSDTMSVEFSDLDYVHKRCVELCQKDKGNAIIADEVARSILEMYSRPLIVTVLKPNVYSADEVDQEIYVVNPTEEPFVIRTRSDFFQTVNEETGEGITAGPEPRETVLKPHSAENVGDVLGWELDFALGFIVEFKHSDEKTFVWMSCDLRSSPSYKCLVPFLEREGFLYRVGHHDTELEK